MADKALIVAISNYKSIPLPGADNDYEEWSKLVTSASFKFDLDPKPLRNEAATKSTIEEYFKKLVNGASNGDRLLFYYSGHGTQTLYNNSFPVDGLVAYSEHEPDAADIVFDFEIVQWIKDAKLPTGAKLTFILDCCFAEGVSVTPQAEVASGRDRARFLPIRSGDHHREFGPGDTARGPLNFFSLFADAEDKEPLRITATGVDGAAYEGDDGSGVIRGLFSHALAEVVKKNATITHNDAVDSVGLLVGKPPHTDQQPSIHGSRRDNPFLT